MRRKISIRSMKLIDELLGPIVCFGFHIYNMARRPFVKYKLEPDRVRNIVLIKFFGIGSIMLAGPMIRALKGKFKNARIIILTFSSNVAVCRRIKLIDEVVAVRTDNWLGFMLSLGSAILRLRKKRCEISIDLEFFAKSSTLIQYLCGTPVRVGYYLIQIGIFIKMMWRGNLLTHQVYYNPHRHATEVFLALARALGADTGDLGLAQPEIFDADREKVKAIFQKEGISGQDYTIAMNINASPLCIERRWPMEYFAQLADKLRKHKNVRIILIGDTGDVEYVRAFMDSMQSAAGIIDLTGKLDIGALCALLSSVKLLITNDSGPMHLAASLGTPVAALFGPEVPERFGPAGGPRHLVFYSGVYCSPCLNVYNQKTAPCLGDNACMKLISPEEVYRGVTGKYGLA